MENINRRTFLANAAALGAVAAIAPTGGAALMGRRREPAPGITERENTMENINRRTFLANAAALGAVAAIAPTVSFADETPAAAADPTEAPNAASIGVDVSNVPFGVQGLTVDQMNQIRDLIIEPKTEYVKADGTVVPEVYVKLRALFDTIGLGLGSDVTDASYDVVMFNFTEDEAQAVLEMPRGVYFTATEFAVQTIGLGLGSDVTDASYDVVMFNFTEDEAQAVLEMPRGVYFTATEFAVQSGRDEAECLELCQDLSKRGLIYRANRAGVPYFHLVAHAHGMWEYGLLGYYCNGSEDIAREYCGLHQTQWGAEVTDDFYNAETTFYYPIPVNAEVVADAEILPYDDYEKVIERNSIIGVSPCQCRLRRELQNDKAESCDHPLETCLTFGEEAEYYIENGMARAIDKDEAREILQRSIDAGMVIQSAYTKNTEVICQCHGDCCDILSSYVALGEALNNDIAPYFNAFGNLSQSAYTKNTEVICQCHGDCCDILSSYVALGEALNNDIAPYFNAFGNLSHYNLVVDTDACIKCGACADRCPMFAITMDDEEGPDIAPYFNAFGNLSHYNLVVDTDACIKCGACADRCPMFAITMDDEEGPVVDGKCIKCGQCGHYNLVVDTDACIKCGACADRCPMFAITMDDEEGPVVDGKCIKCGQCGTVCPVEARKLTARDDCAELPESMLDDYNLKSSYRLSHGMVH